MNPQDIQQLQHRVELLEQLLYKYSRPDSFIFQKPLHGGNDGLRLLTSANEKIAFFGVTPVRQYSTSFNSSADATYSNTEQNMLNEMQAALLSYGLIHS